MCFTIILGKNCQRLSINAFPKEERMKDKEILRTILSLHKNTYSPIDVFRICDNGKGERGYQ